MDQLLQNPYFAALFAIPGTLFFAMSLKAPRRSLPMAAIGGFLGQIIYVWLTHVTNIYISVFFATFITCVVAEVSSRIFKTPATVISYSSLIPLVPGVMLYNAMLDFSQSNMQKGAMSLMSTVIYTGCMAIAITLAAVILKNIMKLFVKREKK